MHADLIMEFNYEIEIIVPFFLCHKMSLSETEFTRDRAADSHYKKSSVQKVCVYIHYTSYQSVSPSLSVSALKCNLRVLLVTKEKDLLSLLI